MGAIGEFELIRRFFTEQPVHHPETVLGIGDDCAILSLDGGTELAVTTDTLVVGVHFLAEVDPADLGHKSLAVNLSDLAAVGAEPLWVSLGLTLPSAEESWLERFSKGLFALAARHGVELIGGDTTRGPLSVSIQAMGRVPKGGALRRSGARVGDAVYLTGSLGDAGLGLKTLRGGWRAEESGPLNRLLRPEPRIGVGRCLPGLASACIDVSDGLTADLFHVLEASGVGALVEWERLPFSPAMNAYLTASGDWRMPLMAGDDYELCFTVPPERLPGLESALAGLDCPVTRIGRVEAEMGLRLARGGEVRTIPPSGYQHFLTESTP